MYISVQTHLSCLLGVHFLLNGQVQVGCHDDVRSLVSSVLNKVIHTGSIHPYTQTRPETKCQNFETFYKFSVSAVVLL